MEIFKLFGSIFVDTNEADRSINNTDQRASNLAATLGKGIKTAGKWAAGIGAAAVAVAGAMSEAVNQTAEYADEIDKASKRTGITVESLQRMRYAAEQNGVEFDKVQDSAKELNNRLGELSEGNEETALVFEKLGIAVYDSNGAMRSTEDIYDEAIKVLADMGDTAERTALGTKLFGEGITDLKPLLAAGSQGIQDLKDNADALGIVMSQDAVTAGVVYGDTIADIKNALGGMVRSLGASVLPMFQKFADKIIEWMPQMQRAFAGFEDEFNQTAAILLDVIFQLLESLLPPLLQIISDLMPLVSEIIETVLPLLVEALKLVSNVISEIVLPALDAVVQFLNGDWIGGIETAANAYVGIFESAFSFIDGLFGTNLSKWYQEVTDFYRDAGAKLFEIFHADELQELEDYEKYFPIRNDITRISNEYMRQGMGAEEALNKAIAEVVDTPEEAYYYEKHFKDQLTVEQAEARLKKIMETEQGVYAKSGSGSLTADYYEAMGKAALEKTPALASGGLVFGKTLAFVGDNADAAVNPEVVAPLSELQSIAKNDNDTQLLSDIKGLLTELVETMKAPQKVEIPVTLPDGTKLATAMVNNINALIRNSGKNVFIQV